VEEKITQGGNLRAGTIVGFDSICEKERTVNGFIPFSMVATASRLLKPAKTITQLS
jgi:hypothetical protein